MQTPNSLEISHVLPVRALIDPSQTPPSLVTVAIAEKPHYTSWSKEKTDNLPTDKTEQVTSDMKQMFIHNFLKKFKQYHFVAL